MENQELIRSFQQNFRRFVSGEKLFTEKSNLLLALSGGIDSVVLMHVLHSLGYSFGAAHCNFRLRGDESERDEAFAESLCRQYGVAFHCKRFDTEAYAAEKKVSIQVAARELRYAWFDALLKPAGITGPGKPYTHIVTAHHMDDNVETVLMNFFKGTGISGMRGIQPVAGRIVRPLLFSRKQDLRDYAVAAGIGWVEDRSNAETDYTRNFIRLMVLPLVRQQFPAVDENLARSMHRFRDVELLYREAIELHRKKLLLSAPGGFRIPVEKLRRVPAVSSVVYELLAPFGFNPAQVPELIRLMDSQSGKYVQSDSHRVLKNRNWFIITERQAEVQQIYVIERLPASLMIPGGNIEAEDLQKVPVQIPENPELGYVDAADIRLPLLVRKWKTGDYFYPLGMRKKKKLSRFFIDSRLSVAEKENTWVVESDKRILWIIGKRIDDRFKIRPSTSQVLKLSWRAS